MVEVWDRTRGLSFVGSLFRRCDNEASAKPCAASEANALMMQISDHTDRFVGLQFREQEIVEPLLVSSVLSGYANKTYVAICAVGTDMDYELVNELAAFCSTANQFIAFPIEEKTSEVVLVLCVYTSGTKYVIKRRPINAKAKDTSEADDIDTMMRMVQHRRRNQRL